MPHTEVDDLLPKKYAIDLRVMHPTMWRLLMWFSIVKVGLAFNYWFARPTFMPYGTSKYVAGTVFIFLGVSQIVFLLLIRDLRKVRLLLALSGFAEFVWGAVNSQQFFAGKASLALPIYVLTVAVAQRILLVDAPINPAASREPPAVEPP